MQMRLFLMAAVAITLLSSKQVKADAFDDKAQAEAAQEEAASEAKAYAKQVKDLTSNNAAMLRRVPRGAQLTQCYNYSAAIWRDEENGCNLENIQWNGIPVQICSDDYDQKLPPEIVECHYHVAKTGQDCEIVRNSSIKPRCL